MLKTLVFEESNLQMQIATSAELGWNWAVYDTQERGYDIRLYYIKKSYYICNNFNIKMMLNIPAS